MKFYYIKLNKITKINFPVEKFIIYYFLEFFIDVNDYIC